MPRSQRLEPNAVQSVRNTKNVPADDAARFFVSQPRGTFAMVTSSIPSAELRHGAGIARL